MLCDFRRQLLVLLFYFIGPSFCYDSCLHYRSLCLRNTTCHSYLNQFQTTCNYDLNVCSGSNPSDCVFFLDQIRSIFPTKTCTCYKAIGFSEECDFFRQLIWNHPCERKMRDIGEEMKLNNRHLLRIESSRHTNPSSSNHRRTTRTPVADQVQQWKSQLSGELTRVTLQKKTCDSALYEICLKHISCAQLWAMFRKNCDVDQDNQCRMQDREICWQSFEGLSWTGLGDCNCASSNSSDCHWIRLHTNYNKCIYEISKSGTFPALLTLQSHHEQREKQTSADIYRKRYENRNVGMDANPNTQTTPRTSTSTSTSTSTTTTTTTTTPRPPPPTTQKYIPPSMATSTPPTWWKSPTNNNSNNNNNMPRHRPDDRRNQQQNQQRQSENLNYDYEKNKYIQAADNNHIPQYVIENQNRNLPRHQHHTQNPPSNPNSFRLKAVIDTSNENNISNNGPKKEFAEEFEPKKTSARSSCQDAIRRCESVDECRWHLGELRVRCATTSSCRREECSASLQRFSTYVPFALVESIMFCHCAPNDQECLQQQEMIYPKCLYKSSGYMQSCTQSAMKCDSDTRCRHLRHALMAHCPVKNGECSKSSLDDCRRTILSARASILEQPCFCKLSDVECLAYQNAMIPTNPCIENAMIEYSRIMGYNKPVATGSSLTTNRISSNINSNVDQNSDSKKSSMDREKMMKKVREDDEEEKMMEKKEMRKNNNEMKEDSNNEDTRDDKTMESARIRYKSEKVPSTPRPSGSRSVSMNSVDYKKANDDEDVVIVKKKKISTMRTTTTTTKMPMTTTMPPNTSEASKKSGFLDLFGIFGSKKKENMEKGSVDAKEQELLIKSKNENEKEITPIMKVNEKSEKEQEKMSKKTKFRTTVEPPKASEPPPPWVSTTSTVATTTTVFTTHAPPPMEGCHAKDANGRIIFTHIGAIMRRYVDWSGRCSTWCECESEDNLTCEQVPCLDSGTCDAPLTTIEFGERIYLKDRGLCYCETDNFVCEFPEEAPEMYPGLYLSIGYSLKDVEMIRKSVPREILDKAGFSSSDASSDIASRMQIAFERLLPEKLQCRIVTMNEMNEPGNALYRIEWYGRNEMFNHTKTRWHSDGAEKICSPYARKLADHFSLNESPRFQLALSTVKQVKILDYLDGLPMPSSSSFSLLTGCHSIFIFTIITFIFL